MGHGRRAREPHQCHQFDHTICWSELQSVDIAAGPVNRHLNLPASRGLADATPLIISGQFRSCLRE